MRLFFLMNMNGSFFIFQTPFTGLYFWHMAARLIDCGTSFRMGGSDEKSERGDVIQMARKRGYLFPLQISCSSNECSLVHAERCTENVVLLGV